MPNPTPTLGGLREYQVKRKEETIKKVRDAVKVLKKTAKSVNFKTVSEKSGVSTVTIYKYSELVDLVNHYRNGYSEKRVKRRSNVTIAQIEVINEGLAMKVQELKKENNWYMKRIEVQNLELEFLKKEIVTLRASIENSVEKGHMTK